MRDRSARLASARGTTRALALAIALAIVTLSRVVDGGTWLRAVGDSLSSVEVMDESHAAWPPDRELRGDATGRHALDMATLKAMFSEFELNAPIVYPDAQRSWEDIGVASGFDHRDFADADEEEEEEEEGEKVEVREQSAEEKEAAKNKYFAFRANAAELQPMLNKHGGTVETALQIINARLKIDPNNPFLLADLGNTHRILGENKQAVECFTKALRFVKHFELYQLLGSALMALGRTEEAVKVFTQGLEKFPADTTLRLSLGLTYSQLENWREAMKCFKRVLRHNPNSNPNFAFAGEQLVHARRMEQMKSSVLLDTAVFVIFVFTCALAIWFRYYSKHKFGGVKGRHVGHKKRK